MGIPRFAYRMRDYARTEVIGSQQHGYIQRHGLASYAVIDGPSLSHLILQSWRNSQEAGQAIIAPCDYAEIGRMAVAWLDMLLSNGFEIEGIYFDGALPDHKKSTRIARLQGYADHLAKFKRIHDELSRSQRFTGINALNDANQRGLESARKQLAPPPLLVFAVVEALFCSKYAKRTWVVPGEADSFCAAAGRDVSLKPRHRTVTIFTNDSDLLIYPYGAQGRVVMLDTIQTVDKEDGKVLTARRFFPFKLAQMGSTAFTDLIRPAFAMQRPYVTFVEALEEAQRDVESKQFEDFRESFSTTWSSLELRKLRERRKTGIEELQIDSRVAEFIRSAMNEASRLACTPALEESQHTSDQDRDALDPADLGHTQSIEVEREDVPKLTEVPTVLDMYLPFLPDDPSRASAWKIGALFRYAAESLVLSSVGIDRSVLEYRKSSNGFVVDELKKSFTTILPQRVMAWTRFFDEQSRKKSHLNPLNRWRSLIMHLMLADIVREGIYLPQVEEIASVMMAAPPMTWNIVHLKAQYEAEYYSLRMLKQVLGHMKLTNSSISWLGPLLEQIDQLPGIAEFFCRESEEADKVDRTGWKAQAEEVLLSMGVEAPQTAAPKKAKKAKEKAKGTTSTLKTVPDGNMFAMLSEE